VVASHEESLEGYSRGDGPVAERRGLREEEGAPHPHTHNERLAVVKVILSACLSACLSLLFHRRCFRLGPTLTSVTVLAMCLCAWDGAQPCSRPWGKKGLQASSRDKMHTLAVTWLPGPETDTTTP